MTPSHWVEQLAAWRDALASKGATISRYEIGQPLSADELLVIERASGRPMPTDVASVLTTVCGRVEFFWQLELRQQDPTVPEPLARFGQIGELAFDAKTMRWLRAANEVVEDDRYLSVGQAALVRASLAFYRTSEGDILAVDVRNGAVNYLTYASGYGEAVLLAPTFVEFLDRFTSLGCVGPEIWVLELTLGPAGIDANANLAKQWRAWTGVGHSSRVI